MKRKERSSKSVKKGKRDEDSRANYRRKGNLEECMAGHCMRGKNNSKQFTAGKKQAQNKILGRHNKPLQERKQELIANYYRKHRKEMQAWLQKEERANHCWLLQERIEKFTKFKRMFVGKDTA